ncbi:aldehyde dehydrogenase [Enterovirga rhinocerotis]|uniref:Acyl-CoA reductase-like NAD-dependent aldehyde dehydrogenase n=1 Tax=Enterovirga rhinocerotis TaxID=1339210 RepID=A0A4R7BVG6_9HYPH|nr:aldehyde dehydrogenase [Enterovirga rhinocerotis]TDR88197.1 acyl-CoA reductase-like NAD-dependent aldehyde dehydrogenase [Enterovirga rhinocerotis]
MTLAPNTSASSDEMITSINPANGSVAGTVTATSPAELDAVVERAWTAFRNSGWAESLPHRRALVLQKIADGLLAEKETLARLQMADNGKPLGECRGMVESAIGTFRYYAGVCETLETDVTPSRGDYVSLTVLEPFGVVACITPWNSPIMNDATKVAPALAAGNAVILKPSEDSPLLAPELARIALAAGLPEGMLQVVQGKGPAIGSALVAHPGVRMISFTGGTATGRAIGRIAGERLVPAALELGGKSPHVVFADADLDHAVAAVVAGIFGSAGQSCVAGSRLFVEASIYDEVLQRVVDRAKSLKVDAPDAAGVEMGPLASFHHRERVAAFVDRARQEGGRILCGGEAPTGGVFDAGAYYLPTVIDGLGPDAASCQEEAFGPVLVALPFRDEADLISQANGTAFGLACGIWSESFKRCWRIGRALEAGSVWINTYKQSVTSTPFGGFKNSGLGREKGIDGLRLYAQVKSMYFGLHEHPLAVAK